MKGTKFGKSHFGGFLRHNGVYVALTLGLAAVCLVGLYGATRNDKKATEKVEERPVELLVTDQPDERVTTTTATTKDQTTSKITTTSDESSLYVFPLSNTVQKPFSTESPAYSETMEDWRLHLGADFAGELGQTVKATAGGTVSEIAEDKLWGNVIIIDHGVGVISRYCGVVPSVKVGDKVDAAAPIGKLADIPCESSQPPHLHMELTVEGAPVDPVTVIGLDVRYGETTSE